MRSNIISKILIICLLLASTITHAQTADSIVLKDIQWNKDAPAGMTDFVCLKALAELPCIKKGFALSTWDIYAGAKDLKPSQSKDVAKQIGEYFVLNTTTEKLVEQVMDCLAYYNIQNDSTALSNKQIMMLDEHNGNKQLAETIKNSNHNYFDYEVWQTDHPFTNKRISLINKVIDFLDRN